jgi:hypothetical protein
LAKAALAAAGAWALTLNGACLDDLRDLPPMLVDRERGAQPVEPEQDQQHRGQVGGDAWRQDEHGPGQQQQADRGRVDAEQPHRYPGDGQEQ